MSKKKIISGIIAGAVAASMLIAHVMKKRAKKSEYSAKNMKPIEVRKMGFYEKYVKRMIDVGCAMCAIVAFSPLYLGVALLVRIKLGSPVLLLRNVQDLSEVMGKRLYLRCTNSVL